MIRQPDFVKGDKKPLKAKAEDQKAEDQKAEDQRAEDQKAEDQKAEDQSHKPARHIEETARLASSVEKAKNPGKVRDAKD
jgi:hypothetical protein